MLYIAYFIIVSGHHINFFLQNSIAFGKSTS